MKYALFESEPKNEHSSCEGQCKNCGKAHIKVLGRDDADMKQLTAHIKSALEVFPMKHRLVEVTDAAALELSEAAAYPALLLDGTLVSAGETLSVAEILNMFCDRYLAHSKLHQLRTILVPVDMSPVSGNALRFAYQIALHTGSNIEVLHVMDSIFEGQYPSPSGFLANYQKTLQRELDEFIEATLKDQKIVWGAEVSMPSGITSPQKPLIPIINAKVTTGFPDSAIEEHSVNADLIVMGTSGKTSLSERLFGSISIEVSKFSHCSALFIPQTASFKDFKNILYASNFESLNVLRIRQAIAFAKHFDSQIHFVHVGPPSEEGISWQRTLFEADYSNAQPGKPFLFCKMVENEGVLEELYEYAYYHQIGLFVFVTHQRNFLETLLHKSVTRKALLNSDLPILIMHSDDDMN